MAVEKINILLKQILLLFDMLGVIKKGDIPLLSRRLGYRINKGVKTLQYTAVDYQVSIKGKNVTPPAVLANDMLFNAACHCNL